jgi:serine/threonine-protein kinase RIO1
VRAIMRLARCDVGQETAALDRIYEIGYEALGEPVPVPTSAEHEALLAGVATEAPAPPLDDARDVLTELLRLYDWRFELAEREKDPRSAAKDFKDETRRLLNQYGAEKKAAWAAARRVLRSSVPATPPQEKK